MVAQTPKAKNYPLALYTTLTIAGLTTTTFTNGFLPFVGGNILTFASLGAMAKEMKEKELGVGACVESIGTVINDLWNGTLYLGGEEAVKKAQKIIYTAIPDLGLGEIESDPHSFITDERAVRSKWIVGQNGSFKSRLASYLNTRIVMANPKTAIIIADPHYPKSNVDWMPGISQERFEELHLKKDFKEIFQTVLALEGKMLKRINGEDTTTNPIHLVIDEFVGLYKTLNPVEKNQLVDAVANTQYQGRKFGIDITCILHSAKNKVCGLDSSVFLNGDLYLLGSVGADKQQQANLPDDIDWKKQLSEKTEKAYQVKNPKQIIIYRDKETGLTSVEKLPDPIFDFTGQTQIALEYQELISPDQWLEQHWKQLEDWFSQGRTASSISKKKLLKRPDGKNLRRDKNENEEGYKDPYYAALVDAEKELKRIAESPELSSAEEELITAENPLQSKETPTEDNYLMTTGIMF